MIVLGILLLVMPEGVGFAINYTGCGRDSF